MSVSQKSFEDIEKGKHWQGGCCTGAWTSRQLLTFCTALYDFSRDVRIHGFDVITSLFSGYMFGGGTTAHRHTRTVRHDVTAGV